MSLIIPFPCLDHVETLHSQGFKFLMKEEQGWVCFKKTRLELQDSLPQELYNIMSDRTSMQDFMDGHEADSRLAEILGVENSEDYQEWLDTSLKDSLANAHQAEAENLKRMSILGQIKMDFFHPQIEFSQGYNPKPHFPKLQIGGTLASYHVATLNSLFYSIGHFLLMSPQQLAKREINHCINQEDPSFESILRELKIIALADVLAVHYKVPSSDKEFFFQAMADYQGAEDFFIKNLHHASSLESYSKDDNESIEFTVFHLTNEGVDEAEARVIAQKSQQDILHRRHKIQVIKTFYEKKLHQKYTIDHVRFMFEQQLNFLKD